MIGIGSWTLFDRLGLLLLRVKVHRELESPQHGCHLRDKSFRPVMGMHLRHHVNKFRLQFFENHLTVFDNELLVFLSKKISDTVKSCSKCFIEKLVNVVLRDGLVAFLNLVHGLRQESNFTGVVIQIFNNDVRNVGRVLVTYLTNDSE